MIESTTVIISQKAVCDSCGSTTPVFTFSPHAYSPLFSWMKEHGWKRGNRKIGGDLDVRVRFYDTVICAECEASDDDS